MPGVNAVGESPVVYGVGTMLWEVVGFPVASPMVANLAPAALRGRYQGAFAGPRRSRLAALSASPGERDTPSPTVGA